MSEKLEDAEIDAIRDLVTTYQFVKRSGKFLAWAFVGTLGLIVLINQAWDAIRHLFAR